MARKKVPLDEIRLGKEQEHDKTRYQQIQEERINRNFRRLQEDANDINSHLTDVDSRLTDVDSRLSYIEDGNFDTPLNIIPRRAYATLSSAGWYRVAEFEPTSAYASYDVQGSIGALIRFFITRRYYWTGNETHEVTLSLAYTSIKWMDESSNSVVQGIDKIRYTTNGNLNKGYVDIHYTLSQANQTAVDFEVSCPLDSNGANYQEQIKSMDLVSVADAPVGETVVTTYNFTADKRIGSFGTPVTISTFPYTAKEDGFMWVEMRASSTGRCYANFTGVFICDGYTTSQGYINGTFPIKKGTTLPTPSTSNLQSVNYKWYPLG